MSSDMKPPERGDKGPEARRWARVVPATPVVLSQVEGMSYAAEQYRNLAFHVEQRKQQLGGRCLIVGMSSPDSGTGKTLTALNLALTLAREGDQRVLLVEGDLWKPTLRQYLELEPGAPGLAQLLSGECTFNDAVATVWGTDLDVLLSGETGRTTGLMAQRRLVSAFEEMRPSYEFVVIDAPPIMLASGRALAACADAVLAIVRSGQTKRRGIEESLSILGPEKVLGFVLNAARMTSEAGYAYYSGYARALEEAQGRSPMAARRRRWRVGGAVGTALASLAIGFWLLRSGPVEEPALVPTVAEPPATAAMAEAPPPAPETAPVTAVSTPVGDLLAGARTAAAAVSRYDVSYAQLSYPGGDPGLDRGTAADLVVRAFRQAGLDLQQEIHEDLLESPRSYGATEPDTSIDHRRVRNLMTWFERHGVELGTAPADDWQPGDLVFWATDRPGWPNHVGIVSDRRAPSGRWMVVHHFKASPTGAGAEEDVLTRWPIEGHYRWPGAREG